MISRTRYPVPARRVVGLLVLALLFGGGVLASSAPAEEARDDFEAANEAYADGRYEDAIEAFQAHEERVGPSAALLYNLANAHAAAEHIGPARLAYERARLLDPQAADIQQNLVALLRASDLKPNEAVGAGAWLPELGSQTWGCIALSALALLALTALLFGLPFSRASNWGLLRHLRGRRLGALALVAVLLLTMAVLGLHADATQRTRAVIVDGATLTNSPHDHADPLAALPEGSLVRVERSFGAHAGVRLADGRFGWVRADAVAPVGL